VPDLRTETQTLSSVDLEKAVADRPDCAVICTDHAAFSYDGLLRSGVVIVDTRNALKDRQAPNIFRL
jgi:UDP-N-acetyl-D-mannosaminuronate dehydrogenase